MITVRVVQKIRILVREIALNLNLSLEFTTLLF